MNNGIRKVLLSGLYIVGSLLLAWFSMLGGALLSVETGTKLSNPELQPTLRIVDILSSGIEMTWVVMMGIMLLSFFYYSYLQMRNDSSGAKKLWIMVWA